MTIIQQLPILAASVCLRQGNEVLLVQRGKEPGKGKWAFPGGKVQWGETAAQAALRELHEEAGISARIGHLIGLYEVIDSDTHYAIACYLASHPRGKPQASSDAADARWIKIDATADLPLAPNIAQAIAASIKLNGPR
jgi:8-oxo-dGTP diphosphatase